MSFSDTFRKLVMPDLKRMIKDNAGFVAWEFIDFSDVVGDVMYEAIRRGAGHLPDNLFHELDDWICHELCQDVEKHMRLAMECRPILDWIVAVTSDPQEVACQTMTIM